MKTTRILLSLVLLWIAIACQNETDPLDDSARKQHSGLVGKWKIVEFLGDPGDGSGTYKPVPDGAGHVIEFKANGQFIETKGIEQSSVSLFNAYKILDGNRIEMIPVDRSTPSHTWFYSDLSADKVTLGYGCIETCSGKYVAVD